MRARLALAPLAPQWAVGVQIIPDPTGEVLRVVLDEVPVLLWTPGRPQLLDPGDNAGRNQAARTARHLLDRALEPRYRPPADAAAMQQLAAPDPELKVSDRRSPVPTKAGVLFVLPDRIAVQEARARFDQIMPGHSFRFVSAGDRTGPDLRAALVRLHASTPFARVEIAIPALTGSTPEEQAAWRDFGRVLGIEVGFPLAHGGLPLEAQQEPDTPVPRDDEPGL